MNSDLHRFKAEFFKALGHPLRLAIFDALRAGELSVSALQSELGTEQSTLSQQLTILRQKGFINSRKDGTNVYYKTTDPELYVFLDLGKQLFERHLQNSSQFMVQLVQK